MGPNQELAKRILKRGYFTQFPVNSELYIDNTAKYQDCVFLWRKVLDQALVDLIRGPQHFQKYSEDIDENITWFELQQWFDPYNIDFQAVCYLGGLEPHIVYRKIDEIVNLNLIPKILR